MCRSNEKDEAQKTPERVYQQDSEVIQLTEEDLNGIFESQKEKDSNLSNSLAFSDMPSVEEVEEKEIKL